MIPAESQPLRTDLYQGSAGVILFFSELHRATADEAWIVQARSGGNHLVATLPDKLTKPGEYGLYSGIPGVAYALHHLAESGAREQFRPAAMRCVELIHQSAQPVGDGVEWNKYTDIMFGVAGTGLFLLYAGQKMGHRDSIELARAAGRRLISLAVQQDQGVRWLMSPDAPNIYPNFAHGTAGVSYFLTTLFQYTGDKQFLDAAIAGARYLQAIAITDGDGCLIFRHEPDARNIYYLGWCHGAAGTGRLFYQLWRATGDDSWLQWLRRSARGVLNSGISEKQTPGFWNNFGQCCGSASVTDFFLNLYQVIREPEYLKFAERMTAHLMGRASRSENGELKWIHAEFRVKPEQVAAQTGYMQGAAGIGTLLLRMDAFNRRKSWNLWLPDSPFAGRQAPREALNGLHEQHRARASR